MNEFGFTHNGFHIKSNKNAEMTILVDRLICKPLNQPGFFVSFMSKNG